MAMTLPPNRDLRVYDDRGAGNARFGRTICRSPAPTSATWPAPTAACRSSGRRLSIDVAIRFLRARTPSASATLGFNRRGAIRLSRFVIAVARRGSELGFRIR